MFFIYLFAWLIFGLIHSISASNLIKERFDINSQYFRIGYNILNTITLVIVLIIVPSPIKIFLNITTITPVRAVFAALILILGTIITSWGLKYWNLSNFLGLSNEESQLISWGAYKFSRHPVYSGIILILLSLLVIEFSLRSLSWFIGMGGYFILGTIPEEIKLENHFGKQYVEYKQNTPRLFPWKISHLRQLFKEK